MSICDDPYHCNCFKIQQSHFNYLRSKLIENKFFNPPQENHGQVFGLAKDLNEKMQVHVKVMPNGNIEAEVEPSIRFIEHLDQSYSSPAHNHVKSILDALRVPYEVICMSRKCLEGRIKMPTKTTSVIALLFGVIVVLGAIVVLAKK